MSTPATVPAVYAQALLDLAQEQGVVSDVVAEVQALQQLCADTPELLAVLTAGGQPRKEVARAKVKDIFTPHFSQLVVNFLGLLSDRGRLDVLPDILRQRSPPMKPGAGWCVSPPPPPSRRMLRCAPPLKPASKRLLAQRPPSTGRLTKASSQACACATMIH